MRRVDPDETCPLPEHPVLAAWAAALDGTGQWAEIFDAEWHGLYLTAEARSMFGNRDALAPYVVGAHMFSEERVTLMMNWAGGQFPLEILRKAAAVYAGWMIFDTPGGADELLRRVDPRVRDSSTGRRPGASPRRRRTSRSAASTPARGRASTSWSCRCGCATMPGATSAPCS